MKVFFRAVVLATLLAQAPTAQAIVQITGIVPAHPQAGEAVSLIVRDGICDALSGEVEVDGGGNSLLMTVGGRRFYTLCFVPVVDNPFVIGTFSSGSYTLQLDFHYNEDFPNDEGTETVGTIQFDVAPAGGATAASVPTIDLAGRLGLALSLLAISAITLRWRLR